MSDKTKPLHTFSWRRQLQGDLDLFVPMALRNEPKRRYSSAEQLAEDVQRYLDDEPVRAQEDTWAMEWGSCCSGILGRSRG